MRNLLVMMALLIALPANAKKPKKSKKNTEEAPLTESADAAPGTVAMGCPTAGSVARYAVDRTRSKGDALDKDNEAVLALHILGDADGIVSGKLVTESMEIGVYPPPPMGDLVRGLLERSEEFPVPTFDADVEGADLVVTNLEAQRQAMGPIFDELWDAALQTLPPEGQAQMANMKDTIVTVMLSDASLSQEVLEIVQPSFSFSCGAIEIGERTLDSSYASPLDPSVMLPSELNLTITDSGDALRIVSIERLGDIDTRALLSPLLEASGVDMSQFPEELLKLTISAETDLTVNKKTGLADAWTFTKTVQVIDQTSVEATTVKRLE